MTGPIASRLLQIAVISILALNSQQPGLAQEPVRKLHHTAPKIAVFYPFDSDELGRTDLTHVQTATAAPHEVNVGKRIFQVFTDKRTGRELFRVDVGNNEARWWVYGLLLERDFNGDGVPDFSWHGGDDTSSLNLIVLSHKGRYRKVDAFGSLEREWKRRFPSDPIEDLDESETAEITDIKLTRQSDKLVLEALIKFTDIYKRNIDDIKTYTHRVRVPESRFVYMK